MVKDARGPLRSWALRRALSNRRYTWVTGALTLVATLVLGAATAQATTVFSENWESGTLDRWSVADTSATVNPADPVWQVLTNPQQISVANPGISPSLVTLPDSGSLPAAHGGSHAAWFGDTTSGTFCGADWANVDDNQATAKDGCTSREPFSRTLTSPSFSLAGASSATLHFFSWWEIEGFQGEEFDLMKVQYSTDRGDAWSDPVALNPLGNTAGATDQSYSNNGLEMSPTWHEYLVDLTPAAGSSSVQVRFTFDTGDDRYNGFRGWLIDDISVSDPADVAAPRISGVTTCESGQPVAILNGSNFVEESQAIVDGSAVATNVVSSNRIELSPLDPGTHSIQVESPDGAMSNTFQATADSCRPPSITAINPSAGPSAGGTVVTITGTNFTNASAVNFGPNTATGFRVGSDTQITATAPAGTGTVDVTVTTPAGASSEGPTDQFTYVPPAPPPQPRTTKPGVQSTNGASSRSSVAGFSGNVNPGGLPTTAHFEYGLDSRYIPPGTSGSIYDQSTPDELVGSDFAYHAVTASVTGLVPNSLYHLRLVAKNSAGTTFGPDVTFTTPKGPPPAPPTLGKSFTGTATGLVLIEVNGKLVPITELSKIPNGAIIDALNGTLTLNTATGGTQNATLAATSKRKPPKRPKVQTGKFGGAVFKVTQSHSGLATLSLVEGAKFKGAPTYASCKTKKRRAVTAALSKKTLQLLHGRAHGKFRSKGRYAAATVRGTIWTIADRCDGTLTHAIKDTVTVNDFVRHKTLILRPGHRYLALANPPRKHK